MQPKGSDWHAKALYGGQLRKSGQAGDRVADEGGDAPHDGANLRRGTAVNQISTRNRFADTPQTRGFFGFGGNGTKLLNLNGERGGTRTHDPMIKSYVF
jgi:hypothetical protein